jgi:hypothetical protein
MKKLSTQAMDVAESVEDAVSDVESDPVEQQ